MKKQQAEQLWGGLRDSLLATEDNLKQIIEYKAWEPLGYASFHEAWSERMSGVQLSGVMEASVIFAMFDSGATLTEAALSVKGVGPKRAKAYHQAHGVGMSPADAEAHAARMMRVNMKSGETFIPAHVRGKAKRRNQIVMDGFTDDEIVSWKREAEELDMPWRDFCRERFREAMNDVSVVNGHVNA